MNTNAIRYKFLRARSNFKKRAEYNLDRSIYETTSDLLPRQQQSERQQAAQQDSEEVENRYDEKLKLVEKNQNKKLGDFSKASQAEMQKLASQLKDARQDNLELSDNLKQAIQQLSRGRQEGGEPEANNNQTEQPTEETQSATTTEDNFIEVSTPETTVAPAEETPAIETPTTAEKVAKKLVKIGDTIGIGEYKYKITNLFGERSGANAVPGRAATEHSRGIDIVGYSADGKKSNVPIALTDGVIVGVNVQGDGRAIKPTQGRSAGYYMDVQMPDGKIMKYMHLGKDAYLNKSKLLGTKVKRGDILYQGDYSVGSGSQTSPHIKVSISSVDDKGKQLLDYTNPENNPTVYAMYGKYVEEQ